eukprot:CAMPEP_0194219762 /NCGR_PEP_ID=MMETSP0156-20130528/26802_1 /TAXON_ID=33649 /ORGANISM="Thalassionema nitzschioides, Strain L26-B" /LENGTH=328 /DNA_ID=CAMNT_0038949555 /DNA_START=87 /DNA_END=1073 /DNA_ORIENTATION=-
MGMDNGDKLDDQPLIIENEKLRRDLEEMRKRANRLEEQLQQHCRAELNCGKAKVETSESTAAKVEKLHEITPHNDESRKLDSLDKIKKIEHAENGETENEDIESCRPSHREKVSLISDEDRVGDFNNLEKDDMCAEASDDADRSYGFGRMVMDRAGWLVGLLVLQSMSSFIIQRNEIMLQKHLVIVRFLTMLVGAGGNAGNQASVRVIRGLAVGTIRADSANSFLVNEFAVGLLLSIVLGVAGCLRAAVFLTPLLETIAITTSLVAIVLVSVILGATLPLGMKMVGIDPAHSSTTIQVLMDILGVTITVCVSGAMLDSGLPAAQNIAD